MHTRRHVQLALVLGCLLSLPLVSGCGRSTPEGFRGWMTSFVGTFETVDESERSTRFVQPWGFPCVDCFFVGTEWGRREVSLRFLNDAGERVRLRLGLESLNQDGARLSVTDVPEVIAGEGTFSSDPPEPGHASLYKNGVAIDEGGEIEIFDAQWPLYPGETGSVTLRFLDTSFEGVSLEGAFEVGLAVTEGDAVPEGFGEADQPCADLACTSPNTRCVQEAQRMCRRNCEPSFSQPGCLDDQACLVLDGDVAVCQPGNTPGTRDRNCGLGGSCDDELFCGSSTYQGVVFDTCRALCSDDLECGPGAECRSQQCRPVPPAGFRDAICDAEICIEPDTVCVDNGVDLRCRLRCDVDGDDVCGLRSACLPLQDDGETVCFPAAGPGGSCPCDDGFLCSVIGDDDPPVCRIECDPEAAAPDCPGGPGNCYQFSGDPTRGVCI